MPYMPKATPWGPSQGEDEIAPGIVKYHTASHGGFHLSADRQKLFERRFPDFGTFCGGAWYEEDCDSAAVVIAHWEHFPQESLQNAVDSAKWSCDYHKRERSQRLAGWQQVLAYGTKILADLNRVNRETDAALAAVS